MKENKPRQKKAKPIPHPEGRKKKLMRNPSTQLPRILIAKGTVDGSQLWMTDKNGGQTQLSWGG